MEFSALVSGSSMSRASSGGFRSATIWVITLVVALLWAGESHAMGAGQIARLRRETVDMFYHGYDNYMEIAFPEDEVWWPVCSYSLYDHADCFIPVTTGVMYPLDERRQKPQERGA